MNLFLLAAGEGTRFRPHTNILPKPAIPFCGAPLLYYSFYLAKCLAPKKLVLNTFHLASEVHRVGETLAGFGVEVAFSDEQPNLLGSAGGMAQAEKLLAGDGEFIALNADEVIIPKNPEIMKEFYHTAKSSKSLATLMVMRHPEAGKKFGAVWVNKAGQVLGFGKLRPETTEELIPFHFIGPMYFKERIFQRLKREPSNILHDTLKMALAEGESVSVFPIECDWFETGNLEDYLHATRAVLDLIQAGNPFLLNMQKDLKMGMEFQQWPQAKVLKHFQSRVDATATIKGFAVLGEQSEVGRSACLSESVLANGVELAAEQVIEKALILQESRNN